MDIAENIAKRKRSHMPPVDLQESLDRLREVSARLEIQLDQVPEALRPFVELVQTQTSALEALITSQKAKSDDSPGRARHRQPKLHEETRVREFALETRSTSRCRVTERTTRTIYGLESEPCEQKIDSRVEEIDVKCGEKGTSAVSEILQSCTTKKQLRPSPLSKVHKQTQQISLTQTVETSNIKPYSTPAVLNATATTQDTTLSKASKRPGVLSIQIPLGPPVSSVSPLTPDRSWYSDQTPAPIPSRIQSWRCFPPVDISTAEGGSFVPPVPAISSEHLEHANRALEESNSRRSSLGSASSTSSCQSCSAMNKISDVTSESHVQEALRSLISSMKERKKVLIEPLQGGEFGLYSSEYENCHCIHNSSISSTAVRKLQFYGKNDVSRSKLAELQKSPPKEGEVAMELIVDPNCRLFVEPFKPPKHAGWVWHELKTTRTARVQGKEGGDQKTKVEIMFLGNGFLKLKIRLSDLLGGDRKGTNDRKGNGNRDRFIEFAGIWRSNKQELARTTTIRKETKDDTGSMELMVVRMPSGKASGGFLSGGGMISRFNQRTYTIGNRGLMTERVNEFPSRFLLSPISPL